VQLIRPPAVAGTFYPAQKETLASDVDALLEAAQLEVAQMETTQTETSGDKQNNYPLPPKALIVPHAGYIYSGPTAATAYIQLAAFSDVIKRVILLGPVHRVPVRGLALPGADIFTTPIGEIAIDQDAAKAIEQLPQVVESPAAHAEEHSLEVQLPFLQAVLDDFKLLPLAVGDATPQEVAQVLDILWGGPETLIVISSDLSHFLPYETAQLVDGETAQNIVQLKSTLNHRQACGGTPVNGLMLAAKQHHLQPHLLDLRNSGDTAGDRDRVVGYAAFAFTEESVHVD
jgi:AmmeMemoRadiSam system protein B